MQPVLVSPKFDKGNELYRIVQRKVQITCPACAGRKLIFGEDQKWYKCGYCDGDGCKFRFQWQIFETTIKVFNTVAAINYERSAPASPDVYITYYFTVLVSVLTQKPTDSAKEEDLFLTKEEAQEECDNRNAQKS